MAFSQIKTVFDTDYELIQVLLVVTEFVNITFLLENMTLPMKMMKRMTLKMKVMFKRFINYVQYFCVKKANQLAIRIS